LLFLFCTKLMFEHGHAFINAFEQLPIRAISNMTPPLVLRLHKIVYHT
jgi:hypothetical protein